MVSYIHSSIDSHMMYLLICRLFIYEKHAIYVF